MKSFKIALPNFITSLNLVCGVIATILAVQGNVKVAVMLILAAAIFDFFDGFVARLLHVSSEFGKQMDSLADLISFGFAPAALIFNLILTNNDNCCCCCICNNYFAFISVVLVVFSALRLAKFNIDPEQTSEFHGLPTPASAFTIISICLHCDLFPDSVMTAFFQNKIVITVLILLISTLMVTRIRLLSLKIKNFTFKKYFWQFILLIGIIIFVIIFKVLGLALGMCLYIILSIIKNLTEKEQK